MRIALVSETWSPEVNGVAHTLRHLANHLVAKGVICRWSARSRSAASVTS